MKKIVLLLFLVFLGVSGTLSANFPIVYANNPLLDKTNDYEDVLVIRVIRADTLLLESGEKIRLIGLNAPEAPKRKRNREEENKIIVKVKEPDLIIPVEERAFSFAKDLLEGKRVRLEFDTQLKNEDFQTLAYAFLPDGTFVNAEILKQGFAYLNTSPINIKYAAALKQSYQEGRREKRGLQGE